MRLRSTWKPLSNLKITQKTQLPLRSLSFNYPLLLTNAETHSPLETRWMSPASASQQRSRSTNQYKTIMTDYLQTRKPRRALALFRQYLRNPAPESSTSNSVEGLTWLFFDHGQPETALDAIYLMHVEGYRVPMQLAAQVLRLAKDDLVLHPDKLDTVMQWLKEGITGGTGSVPVDHEIVETVLDVLGEMGKLEWLRAVFGAWLASPRGGRLGPGHERIWAKMITILGSLDDSEGASLMFNRWRTRWLEYNPTTPFPEEPYLANLRQLSVHCRNGRTSNSAAYKFLKVIVKDGLKPTTGLFNELMHLELTKRAYPSFWGLWHQMRDLNDAHQRSTTSPESHHTWDGSAASGPPRDGQSWFLAARALSMSASRRSRHRRLSTPLLDSSYHSPSIPPNHYDFFKRLLSMDLIRRGRRPSLNLAKSSSPLVTVKVLNSVLRLFIKVQDWKASVVVLETFGVRRIEPNEFTHSIVVLGVVEAWERGRLQDRLREEEQAIVHNQSLDDGSGERWRRTQRREQGIAMVTEILKGRGTRMKLWTSTSRDDGESLEKEKEEYLEEDLEPPEYLQSRELRDLGYLKEVLRRCEGLSPPDWGQQLSLTRSQLIPESLDSSVKRKHSRLLAFKHKRAREVKAAKRVV
ncbi:hypothetical protein T439DRAFT_322778 [Meredithblackwellia eburnea MCA 4105]